MAEKRLQGRLVNKHDVESNWLKATGFTPMKGELIVYDVDDNYTYERIKIGDGVTNVNDLPFVSIEIDDNLSESSENPVQNKVIYREIDSLNERVGDNTVSTQIAAAISTKVDQKDFDALTVGGRNLYIGTQYFSGDSWTSLDSWEINNTDREDFAVASKTGYGTGLCQAIDVKAGEQYTLSALVKLDENARLASTSDIFTYQWQYRTSSSGTWDNCNESSATSSKLSISTTDDMNGYQYKCVITSLTGKSTTSSTATLTIGAAAVAASEEDAVYDVATMADADVIITAHPNDVCVNSNDTCTMMVTAVGDIARYQWQHQTATDGAWYNTSNSSTASGVTTNTLTLKAAAYRNGYRYRCCVIDSAGNYAYSNIATLYICDVPLLIGQPANCTVTSGDTAVFEVNVIDPKMNIDELTNITDTDWMRVKAVFTARTDSTCYMQLYNANSDGGMSICGMKLEHGTISTDWTPALEDTTYVAGAGVEVSGTTIKNTGVHSISSGTTNGTISVNTNGVSTDVSVAGLGSAAYTESSAYAQNEHEHSVATDSAAGFMSANDKILLDDLEEWVGGVAVSTQINSALNGAVKKSGDTMTGDLTLHKASGWSQLKVVRDNGADGATHQTEYTIDADNGETQIKYRVNETVVNGLYLGNNQTDLGKPLSVDSGGTGATDLEGAQTNLGIATVNSGIDIPSNSDLNSYTTTGVYRSTSGTTSATLANMPPYTSTGFRLTVYATISPNQIIQEIAYAVSTTRFYRRFGTFSNGTWTFSDWCRVLQTQDGSEALNINQGGTGATTTAAARAALGITPANIGAVKKSGDTMTGALTLDNGTSSTYLEICRTVDGVVHTLSTYNRSDGKGVSFLYNKDGTTVNNLIFYEDKTTLKQPLTVESGGTGATSLASGAALIGNGTGAITTRSIKHNTAVGDLGWSDNSNALTTLSTIAYWNGAYSGTSSNLTVLGNIKTGTWKATAIGVDYGGTGATNAADARANLNAVNKSGDTMTGGLTVPSLHIKVANSNYPSLRFYATSGKTGVLIQPNLTNGVRQTSFYQYPSEMDNEETIYFESFKLPTTSGVLAGNVGYNILTTKNAGEGFNSYLTPNTGIVSDINVLTLSPGIYHHETATSTSNNYPIAEQKATIEVIGQYRGSTTAEDGYPKGYWFIRITYASGKQFINHRYWSKWQGWKPIYNSEGNVIYQTSQPSGVKGQIWLKPI